MSDEHKSISLAVPQAQEAIVNADALLITAGAGMGVDSGLPDFRSDEGFWRAYPALHELGYSFVDLAQPSWFAQDPELAWGFYGHRLHLYRETVPHEGFQILLSWAKQKPSGYFVFTSNVDGQFQKAGFAEERIVECHGSIHFLQCSDPCSEAIWPAEELPLDVDETTMRAEPPLPTCPNCGVIQRPNVLLFHDSQWLWRRTQEQQGRFQEWAAGLEGKALAIIECGVGMAVPTVRHTSEMLQQCGATLIRINPREFNGPTGTISISLGALDALSRLSTTGHSYAVPGNV